MKKFVALTILSAFLLTPLTAMAETVVVEAPKWEDYVPEKYHNPRTDYSRGGAIAMIAVGVELTAMIITSPIGIPMICNGSTRFKHFSYNGRKAKFEKGLKEAEKIQDPIKKQEYYKKLLKQCKLKEENKEKILKKRAKEKAKTEKKAQKELEKQLKEGK